MTRAKNLTREYRELLDAISVGGSTAAELAARLQISEVTVRRRLGTLWTGKLVRATGEGKRGSPRTYSLAGAFGDAYEAGYADAMRRVRQALHEGFVRQHPDTTGCVLVPDGRRAEVLLCRLFHLSAPVSPESRARAGVEIEPRPPVKAGLRLLRGGRRA